MSARRRVRRRAAPPPLAREAPRERWTGLGLLALVLVVGAALRAWLSLNDDGIFWPDEIYQSLEPAHRLVFGQGIMPWEFIEGARNWAFPGLIAALLKVLDLVGLGDPRAYLDVTRLLLSAVSVATAYVSYALARRYGASAVAAAAGASLYALASLLIYLAPRAFSENVSTLPAMVGILLLIPATGRRRDRLIGAGLLGLATLFRLQNAIFAATALGVLVWRRRYGDARDAAAVLAGAAAVYGLLDLATWGAPFRSVQLYIAVNLAGPDLVTTFGSAAVQTLRSQYYPAPDFYARTLLSSMGLPFVVAVILALGAWRRAPDLGLIAVVYFVAHSLIPHKELRYIGPVLPLLGALAGIGIEEIPRAMRLRAWGRPALAGAVVLASSLSAATFRGLTYRELGIQANRLTANDREELLVSKTPDASAYDDPGDVNRLLLVARTMPDLCGIKVESVLPEFQGGYTYLHRNVPLYRLGGPPRSSAFFNYAIALRGTEAGAEVRAAEGQVVLIRLRDSCTKDPAFDARL